MEIHVDVKSCMEMCGAAWKCMELWGVLKCVEMRGDAWSCEELYGDRWSCVEMHGVVRSFEMCNVWTFVDM